MLYLILDLPTIALREDGRAPLALAQAALDAGVTFIQLRAKMSDAQTLWHTARELAILAAGYDAKLLINDRADIAHTLGLDGVHCPTKSVPISALRQTYGSTWLIGKSTHDLQEAVDANHQGASFITLSPLWTPTTKPTHTQTLSLETFSTIASAVDCPVFALGGITPERAATCMAHGASGIAVMSGICLADDPYTKTIEYLDHCT